MAFTKVAPAGIGSTPGDGYRIGDSFLHSTGVEITNINATGIVTAASLDISGGIDFDGHTELDNVNISGVSTFAGNIDANGDLDVDGHTNLDNVNIAGVTTIAAGGKLAIGDVVPSKMLELNSGGVVASMHESTGGSYVEAQFKNSSRHYILGLRPDQSHAFCLLDNTSGSGGVLLKASGHTVTLDHDLDVDGHTNLDHVSIAGVTTSAGIVQAAQFKLLDNAKAKYGTGEDLEIYHNATNSLIQNGTGSLQIITTTGDLFLRGQDNITFNTAGNNVRLRINSAGISTFYNSQLHIEGAGSGNVPLTINTDVASNNSVHPLIQAYSDNATYKTQIGLVREGSSGNLGWAFFTNAVGSPQERLRIKSDGTVGINTTGNFGNIALSIYGADVGEGTAKGQLILKDNAAYNASPTAGIIFQGIHAAGSQAIFAGIRGFKENASDGNYAGALAFDVRAHGAVAYEALRIDSSGRVLIGTTTVGTASADNLVIADSADCGITIRSGSSSGGNLFFTDLSSGDQFQGYVQYDHGNNSLAFGTQKIARLTITSDGQIGVNNSSPDAWHSSYRSIQIHDAAVLYGSQDDSFVGLGANHYLNTSGNFIYSNSDFASRFYHVNGEFYFEGAASGTAGNSFSFTQRLRITSTGQIRIDQATSANNGIRMRPSGWNYDFRMGAVSSSGGSIWLGQNYEPTTNTRDNASYGTNYLRFTTNGEIMLGTGATNTNPGQRIKIKSNGFTGINANEPQTTLNVIGTISTGRNVAREVGTVISQSGNHSGNRTSTNVLNGNKNYEYGYDWLVGPTSGNRTNAYLVIDLGQAYTCDRFVIYNQNEYDHSNREVKNFTLEGSNDNSNWTTLLDDDCGCSHGHEPNPGFSFRLPEGNIYGVDDNEGVSYRYWRFTMKTFHGSDNYGGVMELELYEVGDTTVSANKVGSEICTHSLVAGDISTQRMNGIQMLTSSQGLNIHTGEDASDTWEITETQTNTNGSYYDKSTIRHKRGVMAVSSFYNTGDLFIRIDNLYNLPGNAWWTFGVLILSDEVVGTLAGHHSLVTSINIHGLGSWSSISKHDIRGTMNVSVSSHGSNFIELFVNVNDSSRGPCTVICNGGTFDPPRISFH